MILFKFITYIMEGVAPKNGLINIESPFLDLVLDKVVICAHAC
jgi:hypothetical protein